jgi:tetratricopeptide (TPR) repeat protein
MSGCSSNMELTIEQALQQAVEDHKAGKLQDAERLYRAILQTQPNHPDANHNLGVLAVSFNQLETALPLFKIALEAYPDQEQFWLSYIDVLIKAKQFDNARNVLNQGKNSGLAGEKVVTLEACLALSILAQTSDSSFNQTNLEQVRSPSQIELNTLLEHYQNGRYDQLENLALDMTRKYPDHQFGWKALGAVYKQLGRLTEAISANQIAVELYPKDSEAHNNLGIALHEIGRLEEAQTCYQKAITIKPEFAEAHNNLGNTLKELGRLEEAQTCYQKAIAIKPEYAEAHYNLGNTLYELCKLEESEVSLSTAIAMKPDLAEAHSNLGNTLKELGRLEEAQTCYQKAITIKPEFAEAHNNLGNTLKELGRLEEAQTCYQKAIAIKPEYAEAHNNLGETLKELYRLEEAEVSYRRAIALDPDLLAAIYNLGVLLIQKNRHKDGLDMIRKAHGFIFFDVVNGIKIK